MTNPGAFDSEDRDIEFSAGGRRLLLRLGADVPAPDAGTELLAANLSECSGAQALDLGAGSGVLAIAIAQGRNSSPGAAGVACLDVNPIALDYAKRNAEA